MSLALGFELPALGFERLALGFELLTPGFELLTPGFAGAWCRREREEKPLSCEVRRIKNLFDFFDFAVH
jgi:hypothetical protein